MRLYNAVPPPQASPGGLAVFMVAGGVASVAALGPWGLVFWLLPGVPPVGPFG